MECNLWIFVIWTSLFYSLWESRMVGEINQIDDIRTINIIETFSGDHNVLFYKRSNSCNFFSKVDLCKIYNSDVLDYSSWLTKWKGLVDYNNERMRVYWLFIFLISLKLCQCIDSKKYFMLIKGQKLFIY